MVPEKSLGSHTLRVQDIHEWNSIFWKTCCEDDNFEILSNFDNKLAAVRPHLDIDVACASFDVYWEHDIGLISWREWRMHERLIHIEYESLPAA